MVKYKITRIKWSTWRKMRGMYPPLHKDETIVDYIDRVVEILEDKDYGR